MSKQSLSGTSVTIVGLHYAPETTGNAPYTSAMAEALSAEGAAVHVITGIPHYPQWRITDEKYKSGRYWRESAAAIRITRCKHFVPEKPDFAGRMLMDATFFARAAKILMFDKSEILIAITPTLSALAVSLFLRRKRGLGVVVQDLAGNGSIESGSVGAGTAKLISSAEYAMLRCSDRIATITPRFGQILQANKVHESKITCIPNFSHIQAKPSEPVNRAKNLLGWDPKKHTVVHTGNMGRKQGLEVLIDAARIAEKTDPSVQFVLVGDGNQRSQLEAQAANLTNILFVPPLSNNLYPYALAAADVLVIAERVGVREMSMPSKLTSYTAANRPIIAAVAENSISFLELDRYKAASYSEPGNASQLLLRIQEMRHSPAIRDAAITGASRMNRELYARTAAYERYVEFAMDIKSLGSSRRLKHNYAAVPSW